MDMTNEGVTPVVQTRGEGSLNSSRAMEVGRREADGSRCCFRGKQDLVTEWMSGQRKGSMDKDGSLQFIDLH